MWWLFSILIAPCFPSSSSVFSFSWTNKNMFHTLNVCRRKSILSSHVLYQQTTTKLFCNVLRSFGVFFFWNKHFFSSLFFIELFLFVLVTFVPQPPSPIQFLTNIMTSIYVLHDHVAYLDCLCLLWAYWCFRYVCMLACMNA